MKQLVLFTALLIMVASGGATAQSGDEETKNSRSLEITKSKDQIPLIGEVKVSKIPRSLFLVKEKTIIDRGRLLTAGYITKDLIPFGYISESEIEKISVTFNDIVTINRGASSDVKTGDTFFIYRVIKEVKDPDSKRKKLGDLVAVIGTLKVRDVKTEAARAIITNSYDHIEIGNMVIPEYKIVIPELDPDRPIADKLITGKVAALAENRFGVSEGDVIYINVGRKKGVEEGDIFEIKTDMEKVFKEKKNADTAFKKLTGKAQVIVVRDETSTAVVIDSIVEISEGDTVQYIQERL